MSTADTKITVNIESTSSCLTVSHTLSSGTQKEMKCHFDMDTNTVRFQITNVDDNKKIDASRIANLFRFSKNKQDTDGIYQQIKIFDEILQSLFLVNEYNNLEIWKKRALINAFIAILNGSQAVVVEKPHLYLELCRQLCIQTEYQEFTLYLDVLLDDRNERWFKEELKKNRESEIRKIIFIDQQQVRQQLFDDKICLEKVRRWFLLIYDLDSLDRLENNATNKTTLRSQFLEDQDAANFIWLWLTLFLFMIFGYAGKFCLCTAVALASIIFLFFLFKSQTQNLKNILKGWLSRSVTLLRLIGCIFAGYFAVFSEDFFQIINQPYKKETLLLFEIIKILMLWGILGYFTYFYIFREISNRIKINFKDPKTLKKVSQHRACKVFFKAAFYSLLLGMAMSVYLWRGTIANQQSNHIILPLLPICPEAVLYQAPLAMFIGIFINLLWEDKGLTEPL